MVRRRQALWALFTALTLTGCGRVPSAIPVADQRFAALDANSDGHLTPSEAGLAGLAFQALDRDGDGMLSRLEWQGATDDPNAAWERQLNREAQRDLAHTANTGASLVP